MSFNSEMAHARKFMVYIPMLCIIEHEDVWDKDTIIKDIKRLLEDEPENCSEICKWVEFLYASGQKIADWDINHFIWIRNDLSFWTEKEIEKFRELHDKIDHCTDENEKKKYREEISALEREKTFKLGCLQLLYMNKAKEYYKK